MSRAAHRTPASPPDRKTLLPLLAGEIGVEPVIESSIVENQAISDDRLSHGRIERSIFEGVTLVGAQADLLAIRATLIERSDLSAAVLENSSFTDTRVEGCKLAGANLDRASLLRVDLAECRADLARFQYAKLRHVRFEGCQLRSAYFNGAQMRGTAFDACDLTGADFSGADIAGSDLRRSQIEGIRVTPDQLSGVIVTHDQALYLAGLMGLVIRDD